MSICKCGIISEAFLLKSPGCEKKDIINNKNIKKSSRSPHECKICHNILSSRGALVKHMITHSDSKPFKCDQCEAQFNQNRDLKTHTMQKHTMQRPHVCGICGKGFVHKFYLMEHMTYHTGERKYQCNVCGKTFPGQSALTKHMKRHSNIRNYACHLCSKAFTVKIDLSAHIKLGNIFIELLRVVTNYLTSCLAPLYLLLSCICCS